MNTSALATQLSEQFGLSTEGLKLNPIGNGHINTTMLLRNKAQALVVQKLNTDVFPEPEQLVNNARLIEQHLTHKAASDQYQLEIIKHVPTQSGDYLIDIQGEKWRALEFIRGSYSEEVVQNAAQAEIAANAFGQFAAALQDFDAEQLYPVIPNFHNLSMRIATFKHKIAADVVGRVAACQNEIAFCFDQFSLADELDNLTNVPLRPCHNDTKINNMLFCKNTESAKAVIDLDTCMPGYWLCDFGDMVRTCCSPEAEDSTALEQVKVRHDIFHALVKGYAKPLTPFITEQELLSFWLGAKVLPFMIGLRFLTDYLDGDNYFAIKHPEHNLQRARNQFALYRDIVRHEQTLKGMLEQL
ncbi:phosphotransferase enzyme family protein [Pseudoalteromonas fenneropenaei]|uniref:Phosphotransferase enzyme family protein n=1 Tax=Pseudoalteromonas fenneropenaei TaxID=1737459 RepID=A0ABV7CLI0_9GAMM